MDDLYRELILDHYRNPRRHGLLDNTSIDYEDDNPLCGDHIHLTIRLNENDVAEDVGWEGEGCAISHASASMLYDSLIGKSPNAVRQCDMDTITTMLAIPLTPDR